MLLLIQKYRDPQYAIVLFPREKHYAPYKDPNWLKEQYWNKKLTWKEIAEKCNVTTETIIYFRDKFDIDSRNKSEVTKLLYSKAVKC